MKVVVTGATGNVGTSLLRALADEPAVSDIVGVARRQPDVAMEKVRWEATDVATDELDAIVEGADVVVHLAWLIQPSHDEGWMWRTNVGGTQRVLDAVARTGVGAVVYASSIGAYAPAPPGQVIDETWPTTGVESSQYSRHKVAAERLVDLFEAEHPDRRVVRLRKALVFQADAAAGIRRLFLGPFAPSRAIGRWGVPVVPSDPRFTVQAVHTTDAADAYRRAVVCDVRGAFNIAADPVLTPEVLAEVLGARRVPIPLGALKFAAGLTHAARLQPVEPGWIDLAIGAPVMDTTRARTELDWSPTISADDALRDLMAGFEHRRGSPTPPLDPDADRPSATRRVHT
jgi:UDP-glucose 4-epimerase